MTPTTEALAKGFRDEAKTWQSHADWYRANPDPQFGELAQIIADGTAQRLELIVAWLTHEADKRERLAHESLLAGVR